MWRQADQEPWQRDSGSSTGSGELSAEPEDAAYTLEKMPDMRRDWFATVERNNRARKQQRQLEQAQQQVRRGRDTESEGSSGRSALQWQARSGVNALTDCHC